MNPIPRPDVLDPDRVTSDEREEMTLADHRDRARQFHAALRESCAYAGALWNDLDALRGYLFHSLPPDPRAPGQRKPTGAAPTGPDDQAGWENWINAYAAVTSVLVGPHGDSGFGLGEARRAAELRRSAPNVRIPLAPAEPRHEDDVAPAPPAPASRTSVLKNVGFGALVVLAVRGLLPRS